MTCCEVIVSVLTQFGVPSFRLIVGATDLFVVDLSWLLLNVAGMTLVSFSVAGDSPGGTIV